MRTMPTCSPFGPTRRTSGTRIRSLIRGSTLMAPPCVPYRTAEAVASAVYLGAKTTKPPLQRRRRSEYGSLDGHRQDPNDHVIVRWGSKPRLRRPRSPRNVWRCKGISREYDSLPRR
jgi:hypothetical protein